MPGIRLGYALFGSSEVAEKAASTGQAWSVSTPAQAAGIAALRLDGYVEKTVEVVSTEREFMQKRSALPRAGICAVRGEFHTVPLRASA